MAAHSLAFWIFFHLLIAALLLLDLGILRKRYKELALKQAILFSLFWILAALGFNLFIYLSQGSAAALQFLTAYLVEKSLSIDNLFVFLLIFTSFRISTEEQHKILFWGVLEAILFRMGFILAGVVLIRTFHWMLYVFGVLLVATSAKLFLQKEQKAFSKDSKTYKWLSKILPLTQRKAEGQFVVHEQGKRKFTTLFLVLIGIELSDILFAIDSIPAVFAVTNDPFIAYTSNVFAILGLRALYFCLSPLLSKLQFIRYGLALILLFVGAKMLIGDLYPISTLTSLIVILAILLITALLPLSKRFKAS